MSQKHTKSIAVLTGDIVNSTKLGAERVSHAMQTLSDCATTIEKWSNAPLNFTQHRGDGWQVTITPAKYALRAALILRAALKTADDDFDSYIGIALGQSTEPIKRDLNQAFGSVFVNSGWALDRIQQKKTRTRIGFVDDRLPHAIAVLADQLSTGWSQIQAELVLRNLAPLQKPSYTQLASDLKKSRQTISKSMHAASYFELEEALQCLEAYIND